MSSPTTQWPTAIYYSCDVLSYCVLRHWQSKVSQQRRLICLHIWSTLTVERIYWQFYFLHIYFCFLFFFLFQWASCRLLYISILEWNGGFALCVSHVSLEKLRMSGLLGLTWYSPKWVSLRCCCSSFLSYRLLFRCSVLFVQGNVDVHAIAIFSLRISKASPSYKTILRPVFRRFCFCACNTRFFFNISRF